MPYRSYLPQALDRVDAARRAALIAGAELLLGAVKDEHRGGFTTGAFVTGNMLNSLVRTDPEPYVGGLLVRITTTQTNPPYPLYWFVGHHNLFTRRYERVDLWTPAYAKSAFKVAAEHARVMRERLAN